MLATTYFPRMMTNSHLTIETRQIDTFASDFFFSPKNQIIAMMFESTTLFLDLVIHIVWSQKGSSIHIVSHKTVE